MSLTRARGRGHCAACDRIFTLTAEGTIPGHRANAVDVCAGAYQPPKPGSVTAR